MIMFSIMFSILGEITEHIMIQDGNEVLMTSCIKFGARRQNAI